MTESTTQTAKAFGSVIGLLLFFLAPFLSDLGFALLVAIPSRRQALSSTGAVQGPVGYRPLLQHFMLLGALTLLTLVGFVIWRYFWKQLDNEAPRTYFYIVIGFGSLTLIISLLWVGVKLLAGFTATGLSSTSLFPDIDLPFPFSFLLTLIWMLAVGTYFFGHPILTFLMLRYHWRLIKG